MPGVGTQDSSLPQPTDWSLCAICQEQKKEPLQCPANNKRAVNEHVRTSYTTFSENLQKFVELGGPLPTEINISRLDEGDGIEKTLLRNKAKFHPSCRYKFNNTQLKRRASAIENNASSTSHNADDEMEYIEPLVPPVPKVPRRQSVLGENVCCLSHITLCDKEANVAEMRRASTYQIDENMRKSATLLQDSILLSKLSGGDAISNELKYHPGCLITLYRKAAETSKEEETCADKHDDQMLRGLAFAELTEYLEERRNEDSMVGFRLAELVSLYSQRLESLGVATDYVHSSRLKSRLLAHFPDLKDFKKGRDSFLAFSGAVGGAVRDAYLHDYDGEAMHLARAAKIVRRDILQLTNLFSGSFDKSCQYDSVPESLQALVSMILQGPNVKDRNTAKNQAALSLCQLIRFNVVKRTSNLGNSTRHVKERETPLPLYLGLSVHAQTRKRDLVDTLYSLGLSVSYSRVLEVSAEMGQKACKQFIEENVVCPLKMKDGVFTTGAIDNIDHNPSATTSRDSFHGTSISLFQHPTKDEEGTQRQRSHVVVGNTKTVPDLPAFYSEVPPVCMKTPVERPRSPSTPAPTREDVFHPAMLNVTNWLDHAVKAGKNDFFHAHSWLCLMLLSRCTICNL